MLVATAVLAGCAGPGGMGVGGDDDDDGSSPTPTATASPTASPTGTPPEMPATITVGATDATVALPFQVGVSGAGAAAPIGTVSFTNDVGTMQLDGAGVAAALYEKQVWTDYGLTLYQGFAVGAARWDVFWLYCNDQDGLAYVWAEGVTGPAMHYVDASGTCSDAGASTITTVQLPALSIDVPAPVAGYAIDGADISLADGQTGRVTIDGVTLPFVVFEDVDCTGCAVPGWYELHSIAWDEANDRATFVILYLDLGYPERVFAAYARSLPDFGDPIGARVIPATWTAAPAGTSASAAPPPALFRPPPPHRARSPF